MPLPTRQGAGRSTRVSCLSSHLGLCTGPQHRCRLGEAGQSRRDVPATPCLRRFVLTPTTLCFFPRPWQLLLCRSCAAEGTHRRCSNLTNRAGTWECASCAGVDNGKTHRPHAAGLQGLRAALPELSLSDPGRSRASTAVGLEVHPTHLPASSYSLQCQPGARQL